MLLAKEFKKADAKINIVKKEAELIKKDLEFFLKFNHLH